MPYSPNDDSRVTGAPCIADCFFLFCHIFINKHVRSWKLEQLDHRSYLSMLNFAVTMQLCAPAQGVAGPPLSLMVLGTAHVSGKLKRFLSIPLKRFPWRINMFHLGMVLSAEKPRDGFQLGVILEKTSSMWSSPPHQSEHQMQDIKEILPRDSVYLILFLLFFHSIFVHLQHMVKMLPNICSPRRDCGEVPNPKMSLQVPSYRAGNLQRKLS